MVNDFYLVIGRVVCNTKAVNYIEAYVPDLKTLCDMDPKDALKIKGYGQKTVSALEEIQTLLRKYPQLTTRVNKAMKAWQRELKYLDEHRDIIRTYRTLRFNSKVAAGSLEHGWDYYTERDKNDPR